MRERLINRRQQGDLGEVSAIEWLTRQGATVSTPLGHSPDYDLIADVSGRLLRVQVKTSTCRQPTPNGHERWSVAIRTNGGNQSWTGTTKRFDPTKVDALFVLAGDGRRWLIPASAVEGTNTIGLGGTKYSEFEIDLAPPIVDLVYGENSSSSRIKRPDPGERRSGRAGLGCKPSATMLSGFESLLPHPHSSSGERPQFERKRGRAGQAIIREKRQMTLPVNPCTEAGLHVGDRVRFRADGPGRIVLERIEPQGNTLFA
jgi:Holliday junction resolvase-like predicted endonuclease